MLTARRVETVKEPGRYGDGQGLYLNVAKGGSKNWVLRIVIENKRRDVGLGGYPKISLAHARQQARDIQTAVVEGRNPLAEKQAARAEAARPGIPTFRAATLEVHKQKVARFKSGKHGKNWIQMVEKYAFPTIGDNPLDQIDRLEVLNILTPIWTTKMETARRLRQRLRSVFAWGMAFGYIETNPAGESIDAALVSMPKVTAHFRALPYRELPRRPRDNSGKPIGKSIQAGP